MFNYYKINDSIYHVENDIRITEDYIRLNVISYKEMNSQYIELQNIISSNTAKIKKCNCQSTRIKKMFFYCSNKESKLKSINRNIESYKSENIYHNKILKSLTTSMEDCKNTFDKLETNINKLHNIIKELKLKQQNDFINKINDMTDIHS